MAIPTNPFGCHCSFARTVSANLNELLASGARGLDRTATSTLGYSSEPNNEQHQH